MYGEPYAQKVIGVDFDDTISTNELGWLKVLALFEQLGYIVYIVTYRAAHEWPEDMDYLREKGYKVFCTNRMSKREFMKEKGLDVDIWIDDNPEGIIFDMDRLTGAYVPPIKSTRRKA
jgi:hypothetical protein